MLLFNDELFEIKPQLPDIEDEVINAFVAKFSGYGQYEIYREIQGLITARTSQARVKLVIEEFQPNATTTESGSNDPSWYNCTQKGER